MSNTKTRRNWDVIIVGGGVIGLSLAWRLAQNKIRVLVLDRQAPGREASFASAGMLAPYTEAEEDTPLLRLAIASREVYPGFLKEIESESGRSVHYRTDGALFLALDEHEVKMLQVRAEWQKKMGFAVEALEGQDLMAAEPGLSPELQFGLLYPGDHQLDNRALLGSLLVAIQRHGVEIRAGVRVNRLRLEKNKIVGAESSSEKFTANVTVLASGAWSPEIETRTGEIVPVYPTRGQILAVRGPRPLLRHTLRYEGGYVAIFPESRLLLGGTMEDVGYTKANTVDAMRRILARAIQSAPALNSCEFVEAWSGLRPNTKDHLPILGPSSREGLVYATGHFRNGMLLAPITANLICEWITAGQTSRSLAEFQVQRFQGKS